MYVCNNSGALAVARFDFSWGDAAYHQETLENLKLAIKSTKKLCAVSDPTPSSFVSILLLVLPHVYICKCIIKLLACRLCLTRLDRSCRWSTRVKPPSPSRRTGLSCSRRIRAKKPPPPCCPSTSMDSPRLATRASCFRRI